MKKAVKIIVMVLVAAVLFFGALWIPSFVNTLAENQKIGQKVAMEDKTENKNIGFSLSYTEKIRIFSTWPQTSSLFQVKSVSQILEYDDHFFEKIKKQLDLLIEKKVMDFQYLSENLQEDFQSAAYYLVQDNSYETNGFPVWLFTFMDKKNETEYTLAFDMEQEKIYYINAAGKTVRKFFDTKEEESDILFELRAQMAEYYGNGGDMQLTNNYESYRILRKCLVNFDNTNDTVEMDVVLERPENGGKYNRLQISFGGLFYTEEYFDKSDETTDSSAITY